MDISASHTLGTLRTQTLHGEEGWICDQELGQSARETAGQGVELGGNGKGLRNTEHTVMGMAPGRRDRPSWSSWGCPGGPEAD